MRTLIVVDESQTGGQLPIVRVFMADTEPAGFAPVAKKLAPIRGCVTMSGCYFAS